MKKETVLYAKAIGKSDGFDIQEKYRFVLYMSRYGNWSIRPEQSFTGVFNEYSKLPGWTLESLFEKMTDELMIDAGQNWSVKGLFQAVIEAEEIISQ